MKSKQRNIDTLIEAVTPVEKWYINILSDAGEDEGQAPLVLQLHHHVDRQKASMGLHVAIMVIWHYNVFDIHGFEH